MLLSPTISNKKHLESFTATRANEEDDFTRTTTALELERSPISGDGMMTNLLADEVSRLSLADKATARVAAEPSCRMYASPVATTVAAEGATTRRKSTIVSLATSALANDIYVTETPTLTRTGAADCSIMMEDAVTVEIGKIREACAATETEAEPEEAEEATTTAGSARPQRALSITMTPVDTGGSDDTSVPTIPLPPMRTKRKPSFSCVTPKGGVGSSYYSLADAVAFVASTSTARTGNAPSRLEPRVNHQRVAATTNISKVCSSLLTPPWVNGRKRLKCNAGAAGAGAPTEAVTGATTAAATDAPAETTAETATTRAAMNADHLFDAPLIPASPDFEIPRSFGNRRPRFHAPCFSPVTGTTTVNPDYLSRFKGMLSSSPTTYITTNTSSTTNTAGAFHPKQKLDATPHQFLPMLPSLPCGHDQQECHHQIPQHQDNNSDNVNFQHQQQQRQQQQPNLSRTPRQELIENHMRPVFANSLTAAATITLSQSNRFSNTDLPSLDFEDSGPPMKALRMRKRDSVIQCIAATST